MKPWEVVAIFILLIILFLILFFLIQKNYYDSIVNLISNFIKTAITAIGKLFMLDKIKI